MRRAYLAALIIVFALFGCVSNGAPGDLAIEAHPRPGPTPGELPAQFKLATFNIHMEPAALVAAAIAGDHELRDADVLVLQEVHRGPGGCSEACEIARWLGYNEIYAPGHASSDGDIGVAILSRAPITSAQLLELPYFDVIYNSGRRVALAATIPYAGRAITVYSVHLDNRLTPDERRDQLVPVLEHARTRQTPIVVAGDFNTGPFTWINHVLPIPTGTQDDRLEAYVRANGIDTPATESGPTHRYFDMKLDAIYTRDISTRMLATARASDVSDHVALWGVFAGR